MQILTAAGWRDRNGNGTVDKNGVEAEFTLPVHPRTQWQLQVVRGRKSLSAAWRAGLSPDAEMPVVFL